MKRKPAAFDKQFTIQVTEQMLQFVDSIAARQHTSRADITRQALREYLDAQEDLIGSRSRLGRTVLGRMDSIGGQLIRLLRHIGKTLLAALILLLIERGSDSHEVISRISKLAARPELDKILEPKE